MKLGEATPLTRLEVRMTIQKKSKGAGSLLSLSHHYKWKNICSYSAIVRHFEFWFRILNLSDFAEIVKISERFDFIILSTQNVNCNQMFRNVTFDMNPILVRFSKKLAF